jgi:hypothetical protein
VKAGGKFVLVLVLVLSSVSWEVDFAVAVFAEYPGVDVVVDMAAFVAAEADTASKSSRGASTRVCEGSESIWKRSQRVPQITALEPLITYMCRADSVDEYMRAWKSLNK